MRCVAAFLVALAASPLTAPFTTCDISDFLGHRPADMPAPGHQLAVPDVKVVEDVVTAPLVVSLVIASWQPDGVVTATNTAGRPQPSAAIPLVLRL